jgi:hypothetical protein
LFPVFEFLDEEVVAFGNFGDFAVGAGLEIDVILPGFVDFAGKSVFLPDHFVEMAHTDFGHDGLFLAALEDGGHTRVAAGFVADMVDDVHDSILIPPFWVLNALNLSAHNLLFRKVGCRRYNDWARWLQFSIGVCFTEESWRTAQSDGSRVGTSKSRSQSCDELVALTGGEEGRRTRGHNVIPIEVDKQGLESDVTLKAG